MDRVQAIIDHEKAASAPNKEAGRHMWEAAHLIFEEIQAGKSQVALAREIGKSQTHVCWMNKCWKVIGSPAGWDRHLPDFYEVYYSPEVRGDSAKKDYPSNSEPDLHEKVTTLASLAEAIAAEAARLSEPERQAIRYAIRSLEHAIAARRAA